jgi:hypothetical protein
MTFAVTLPETDRLIRVVCDSFDEVARVDDRIRGNWSDAIYNAIKRRLTTVSPRIEVAFGRDASKPKDEREFLFDFSAFTCVQEPDHTDRYTMQVLIAGEVEWTGDLGTDFEKLMFVDSLVCFFAFPDRIKEHWPKSEIDFFSQVAEKRISHVASRGNSPPPVFIIGSYSGEHRRFATSVIRHEAH